MSHPEASTIASKPEYAHDELPAAKGPVEQMTYVEGTAEEARLVRKIDRHMLPMLWVMYILK